MELERVNLFDGTGLTYEVWQGYSKTVEYRTIIVVKFFGEYRYGSSGKPDASFIKNMSYAAFADMEADGIIVDISEVAYTWGDNIGESLVGYDKYYQTEIKDSDGYFLSRDVGVPYAVLIGSACIEGLSSLYGSNPAETFDWYFEDFQAAWNYVDKAMIKFAAEEEKY